MSVFRKIQRYSLMALAILSFPACKAANDVTQPALTGTQKIIVTGYDWFPIVDKTILTVSDEVSGVEASLFQVTEERNTGDEIKLSERPVVAAYTCDA